MRTVTRRLRRNEDFEESQKQYEKFMALISENTYEESD